MSIYMQETQEWLLFFYSCAMNVSSLHIKKGEMFTVLFGVGKIRFLSYGRN